MLFYSIVYLVFFVRLPVSNMKKQHKSTVVWDYLYLDTPGKEPKIKINSSEWFEWLSDPKNNCFYYEYSADIRLSANKGNGYWRFQRKINGKDLKYYLGSPNNITLEHIKDIAERIVSDIILGCRKKKVTEQQKLEQQTEEMINRLEARRVRGYPKGS